MITINYFSKVLKSRHLLNANLVNCQSKALTNHQKLLIVTLLYCSLVK